MEGIFEDISERHSSVTENMHKNRLEFSFSVMDDGKHQSKPFLSIIQKYL